MSVLWFWLSLGTLWLFLMFPAVIAMAVSSHHVTRQLKKSYKTVSSQIRLQPSSSLSDLLLSNAYLYGFGFVFNRPADYWRLVIRTVRGQELKPARKWMRLWLVGYSSLVFGWGLTIAMVIYRAHEAS